MDLFSPEFFTALLSIVLMDLVLGGDNAIVIGMAARNLPKKDQTKVILMGTGGALVIRTLATLVAVWLLKVPGLLLGGGILLVWMSYKLLTEDKGHEDGVDAGATMWAAVRTVIIADAVMGLDNVLAVAGAAHGSFELVVFGLMISIPIVVWGSTLVIKAINRFPIIVDFGAAVIAYTASSMIFDEPFVHNYVGGNELAHYALSLALIVGVMIAGKRKKSIEARNQSAA